MPNPQEVKIGEKKRGRPRKEKPNEATGDRDEASGSLVAVMRNNVSSGAPVVTVDNTLSGLVILGDSTMIEGGAFMTLLLFRVGLLNLVTQ